MRTFSIQNNVYISTFNFFHILHTVTPEKGIRTSQIRGVNQKAHVFFLKEHGQQKSDGNDSSTKHQDIKQKEKNDRKNALLTANI